MVPQEQRDLVQELQDLVDEVTGQKKQRVSWTEQLTGKDTFDG
jgi:hypothetical protein